MRILLSSFALISIAACGAQIETAAQVAGGTTSSSSSGAGGATSSSSATGGTSVTSTTSSSSSNGSTGGGGGTCEPWNPPGAICQPSVQCVTPHAFCTCDPNNPGCHDPQTGQPVALPTPPEMPPDGQCCTEEGMVCGGYDVCGPLCRCEEGAWHCQTPSACPPFSCPTATTDVLALSGDACPLLIGSQCFAKEGCFHVSCTCKLDPATAEASWVCSATPC